MRPENRRIKRQRVMKLGKIIFGVSDITFDCLVYDETPYGILVETESPVAVPEEVNIQLINGGTFRAIRRWAIGNKIGFEFIGTRINNNETLYNSYAIHNILQSHGITQAIQCLRRLGFFGSEELRKAAEDAEAATKRLELLLLDK